MPDVVNGYKWELYNIAEDYSQANDLAAKMPDKLREMQQLFLAEAAKYQVFPLDNDVLASRAGPKPSYTAGRTEFTYAGELTGHTQQRCAEHPGQVLHDHRGDGRSNMRREGMIVTDGGRFGGYGLYLLKGKPVFTYNLLGLERFRWEGQQALAPGKHTLVFDFKYDGPGVAKGGTGILKVDGKEVASNPIPHTIPFLLTIDETFDVGVRYPHAGGRQGLSGAVPLHRQDRQGVRQARAGSTAARRSQGRARREGQCEQVNRLDR